MTVNSTPRRSVRTGGIKAPAVKVEGASDAAQRIATKPVVQPVVQPVSDLATSVARRFADATGVGQVDQSVESVEPVEVEQDVPTKVWTVSGLLDNPELQPDLFPRSNSKAFMNAVRRTMGTDGMLVTDELVAQGSDETAEEATDRFFAANEELVTQLLVVHDSWYSTSGRLLPAEMRGKLITAKTTLSMPWVGSWILGGSVMQRVLNKEKLLMAGFVPAPSMLAWTETLRGLTPEQVEAIKATKAETTDLGAVAEAIATVIAAANDHFVHTRFGVVEVSHIEQVVAVALKDGGHAIQIVRQARVKDGVINAGSHLNLTPMSRVMSFYELRFADDVIEVESNTLDTVL